MTQLGRARTVGLVARAALATLGGVGLLNAHIAAEAQKDAEYAAAADYSVARSRST
jgi:hypothetical protein